MEADFLETLVKHQGIIYKVARMYRNTKEDQEDLFQEIVFQLWKSYPKFRNDAKMSSWMYRIALNTALAIFRKGKLNIDYQEIVPEQLHPFEDKETSYKEEMIFRALRTLEPTERALISLYLEDYTYFEISGIIGISENYVGVKINRIKNKLKSLLKQ